jgi:hypothetical protein
VVPELPYVAGTSRTECQRNQSRMSGTMGRAAYRRLGSIDNVLITMESGGEACMINQGARGFVLTRRVFALAAWEYSGWYRSIV